MRGYASYIASTMKVRIEIIAACVMGIWASPALADPCEGALPSKGTAFSGLVRYVGGGDGLCIGPASRPTSWIEIRLADFHAPVLQERGGKTLACRAGWRCYDRVVATCALGGRPLGNLLRAASATESSRGRSR